MKLRHLVLFAGFALAACTTAAPEGKPLPDLTFAHVAPLSVNVAAVEIVNDANSSADPRDVSSSFPAAPDITLRRYAERRIQANGVEGTLKFVIEEARIYHDVSQEDNKFVNWTGLDRLDNYDVSLRIRLFVEHPGGAQSNHAILNLKRTISIPQRYSLSEKEQEKFNFLEMLMDDVDKAVTDALQNKMNLVGVYRANSLAMLLAAPEIGREQN